ncbi:MAG: hypothetical protein AAF569_07850 [Pseudomonadota bacterium]
MLDSFVKPYIDKPIATAGQNLVEKRITSTQVTIGGFAIGLLAAFAAGMQAYGIGLILMLINRLSDELDDAVADASTRTPFGTYIDVITNMVFYGAVVLMFGMGQGQNLGAAFVLFCFMTMTSTYYASVILGSNQNTPTTAGKLTFSPGSLIEGTETTIYLILIFLFPSAFAALSMIFGFLCLVTAGGRIYATMQDLKETPAKKPAENSEASEEDSV